MEKVKQYYHRYVVALLLGPALDVVLAIEPVLNEEAHPDTVGEHAGHEGELTAARRLLDSLHQTYGSFIDAVVVDAVVVDALYVQAEINSVEQTSRATGFTFESASWISSTELVKSTRSSGR
jgi:hypothetical protein